MSAEAEFKHRYASLSTEELRYIAATSELVPDAARAMELELTARGVPLERAQHPEATEREVLRLQGSRQKNAYFAIAWAVLSLLFGWRWAYDGSVLGVFAAASLAIAALVLTYQAIRRFPTLTMDSEGFEVANGTPTRKYRWADCTNFHARGQFRWGSTMIGFTQYGSTLAIFNQFEASTEEICELLSKWEARYGLDRIQRSSTGAC
jgi:hypothetical protein